MRHPGSQHRDADQVGGLKQAESKAVRWQLGEVVVVSEEVGGFGSADRSDLITARFERLARRVTMPPHTTRCARQRWQKSEAGRSGSWSGTRRVVLTGEDPRRGSCRGVAASWPVHGAF